MELRQEDCQGFWRAQARRSYRKHRKELGALQRQDLWTNNRRASIFGHISTCLQASNVPKLHWNWRSWIIGQGNIIRRYEAEAQPSTERASRENHSKASKTKARSRSSREKGRWYRWITKVKLRWINADYGRRQRSLARAVGSRVQYDGGRLDQHRDVWESKGDSSLLGVCWCLQRPNERKAVSAQVLFIVHRRLQPNLQERMPSLPNTHRLETTAATRLQNPADHQVSDYGDCQIQRDRVSLTTTALGQGIERKTKCIFHLDVENLSKAEEAQESIYGWRSPREDGSIIFSWLCVSGWSCQEKCGR